MIASEIITKFELQVSDLTELSSSEELDLLNDKVQEICDELPWEFLKTPASGSLSSDANGYYITKPADFNFFAETGNETDNTTEYSGTASPRVIFIGARRSRYQIINYSDRLNYLNRTGYAYLDLANDQIRFTDSVGNIPDTSYMFDYIKVHPTLTLSGTPLFPARFHPMIAFAMAVDDTIIQKSQEAKTYMAENQAKYAKRLNDMRYWNSQFYNN